MQKRGLGVRMADTQDARGTEAAGCVKWLDKIKKKHLKNHSLDLASCLIGINATYLERDSKEPGILLSKCLWKWRWEEPVVNGGR